MKLAQRAWLEVSATTMSHCCRKAGILPVPPVQGAVTAASPPVGHPLVVNTPSASTEFFDSTAQANLSSVLDELTQRGLLYSRNRMSLSEPFYPEDEVAFSHEHCTREELVRAVVHAQDGEEDDDEKRAVNEVEARPKPTYHQVLDAATPIEDSMVTMDEPFIPKLGSLLMQLARAKRLKPAETLKETDIRDFFHRTEE